MKPTTYEQAMRRPSQEVWPGCGDGRCRPCGLIHNMDYRVGDQWNPNWVCVENHHRGCPSPKPEPQHDVQRGRCVKCKVRVRE
jgi:hypothetical protein